MGIHYVENGSKQSHRPIKKLLIRKLPVFGLFAAAAYCLWVFNAGKEDITEQMNWYYGGGI
jgi:hypothetical protein